MMRSPVFLAALALAASLGLCAAGFASPLPQPAARPVEDAAPAACTVLAAHLPGEWENTGPELCLRPIEQVRSCTACGARVQSRSLPAPGHSWGEWKTTGPSSVLVVGERYRVCQVCKVQNSARTSFPIALLPAAALLAALLIVLGNYLSARRAPRPAVRRPAPRGYTDTQGLCYSEIFGNGVYRWDGATAGDPLALEGGHSPLFVGVISGERYFARRIACGSGSAARRLRQGILHPPDRRDILWPSDLVRLGERQLAQCTLTVAPPGSAVIGGNYAVLFPSDGYPPLQGGSRRLAGVGRVNWHNPAVRDIAFQIVAAIHRLNAGGYIYLDFQLDRFLFDAHGRALLAYTDLVYRAEDLGKFWLQSELARTPIDYPPEFALPALVRGLQKGPDLQAQHYSLCAMLFYLFFGRHAYDGRLMDSYSEADAQSRAVKYRDYHKMPVFLFDPDDRQNALGAFDEEQRVIALWEECPQRCRELFLRTLRRANAERSSPSRPDDPPPALWLECFRELGWAPPQRI